MGLVGNYQRKASLARKDNPVFRTLSVPGGYTSAWRDTNLHGLAQEGYVQNGDVYSCVSLIGEAFGGVKWRLYKRRGKTLPEMDEILDHEVLDLLKNPNPFQGTTDFMNSVCSYRELSGNSYIYLSGPKSKPPLEMWPLRPDRMEIFPSGNPAYPIAKYQYRAIRELDFAPEAIIHWKYFHPTNDWYGLSPVHVAARNVDQSSLAEEWNHSLLLNAARPSGALVTEGDTELTEKQKDDLRDEINLLYSGSGNAGRPLLLDGGMKWVEMSLTPAEMNYLEGQLHNTTKICSIFKVPPEMLGIMAKAGLNDSNFMQARKKFWMECLLTKMDSFRDLLNSCVVARFRDPRLYLTYDKADIEALRDDEDALHARAQSDFKSGICKLNEARRVCGYDPDPAGDVYAIPTTVQLVDMSGGKPKPAMPIQPPAARQVPGIPSGNTTPGGPGKIPRKPDAPKAAIQEAEFSGLMEDLRSNFRAKSLALLNAPEEER